MSSIEVCYLEVGQLFQFVCDLWEGFEVFFVEPFGLEGKLDRTAVLKAICSGFKETEDPPICLTSGWYILIYIYVCAQFLVQNFDSHLQLEILIFYHQIVPMSPLIRYSNWWMPWKEWWLLAARTTERNCMQGTTWKFLYIFSYFPFSPTFFLVSIFEKLNVL